MPLAAIPYRSHLPGLCPATLLHALALLVAFGLLPATAQIPLPYLPAMEVVPNARALGMGRAFTAIAEGPSAIWWNPGALGLPSPWSVQFLTDLDETSWFSDANLGVYALSGRIRKVGTAIHVTRLGEGDFGFARRNWDYLAQIGLGSDLAEHFGFAPSDRVRWGIGVSGKYYTISIDDEREPPRYKSRASAIDFDVGSLLAVRVPLTRETEGDLFDPAGSSVPFAGLRAGVVLRNALGTEIELSSRDDWKLPLGQVIRSGIAIEIGTSSWRGIGPIVSGTLSAEMSGYLEDARDDPTRCYGMEVRLLDILSFRYGETRDEQWNFKGVSRGVGIRLGVPGRAGIRFDWAEVPLPLQDNDTEQVSASFWIVPW